MSLETKVLGEDIAINQKFPLLELFVILNYNILK
jgi:hypothetical protein